MSTLQGIEEAMLRSERAYGFVLATALVVLALVIFAAWFAARAQLRRQIADRDAAMLHAVTLMEQLDASGRDSSLEVSDLEIGFDAAIRASRLKGVLGIRLFDTNGTFIDSFPATIEPRSLSFDALRGVSKSRPHSRFYRRMSLSDVFIYLPQWSTNEIERVPILEATVPVHRQEGGPVAGATQFVIEGESIAAEYARLDRLLGAQALLAFFVGGGLLAALLHMAFRQVQRLHRRLASRNRRLQQATDELSLTARASALGAISAHLMHGLKNPLASLSEFVAARGGPRTETDEDWQDALTATRRMQALVNETMDVLASTKGGAAYEMTVRELAEQAVQRVRPLAREQGIHIEVAGLDTTPVSSQTASLAALILVNLLENAVQATPAGGRVRFDVERSADRISFKVTDEGLGFPRHLREKLFLPCKSTREGGSGLGLAISKRLSDHMGATLELHDPPGGGCQFELSLPSLPDTPLHPE